MPNVSDRNKTITIIPLVLTDEIRSSFLKESEGSDKCNTVTLDLTDVDDFLLYRLCEAYLVKDAFALSAILTLLGSKYRSLSDPLKTDFRISLLILKNSDSIGPVSNNLLAFELEDGAESISGSFQGLVSQIDDAGSILDQILNKTKEVYDVNF